MIIDKDRKFQITGLNVEGTFVFSSSDPGVSFSNISGAVLNNEIITTDIIYLNSFILDNAVVTLSIVDEIGCTSSLNISKINPCSNFILPQLQYTHPYCIIANPSGGSGNYEYIWTFDENLFEEIDNNIDTVLKLNPIVQNPEFVNVSLIINDQINGCQLTQTINKVLCIPGLDLIINTGCDLDSNITSSNINFSLLGLQNEFDACYGTQIDWTTLNVEIPSGIPVTITNKNNGYIDVIVTGDSPANYSGITYTVKDINGTESGIGNININVPDCTNIQNITIENNIYKLSSTELVGDTITIPLGGRISSENSIDWNTFNVIYPATHGNVILNANRNIDYTIVSEPPPPEETDSFEWELYDVDGNRSNTVIDDVNFNRIDPPVAVNDEYCAICNESLGPIDITTNDTGEIDKNTINIVSTTENIGIIRDSNSDFIFITNENTGDSARVIYNVANYQGEYSNNAIVTINNICAGRSINTDITCLDKIFNLIDLFSGYTNYTRNWTETTLITEGDATNQDYNTQGGSIVGVDGLVDFTTINPGIYRFTLEIEGTGICVGTTDQQEVIITLQDVPGLLLNSINDNLDGTFTMVLDHTSLDTNSLIYRIEGNSLLFNSTPIITVSQITFTGYFYQVGNNNLSITAQNVCGETITLNQTINNANGIVDIY